MDYSAQAVYPWLERYRQKGIAGLQDNPRSGRPPKEPLLANVVAGQACMSPLCYGYAQGCWSIALLVGHLVRHFALNATRDTVRRALKRARFAWGRGKLYLPKRRDPEIGAKLERLDRALADPEGVKIAADECDMHLMPVLRGTWHPKGKQPEIPKL
jgi:transposase